MFKESLRVPLSVTPALSESAQRQAQTSRLLSAGETESAAAVLGKMEEIVRPGRQREAIEKLQQAAERQAP